MKRRAFVARLGYGLAGMGLLSVAGSVATGTTVAGAAATDLSAASGPAATAARQATTHARQAMAQEVRLPSLEPPTLDPGLAEDIASIDVITQLFDPLLAFDDSGTVTGLGAQSTPSPRTA